VDGLVVDEMGVSEVDDCPHKKAIEYSLKNDIIELRMSDSQFSTALRAPPAHSPFFVDQTFVTKGDLRLSPKAIPKIKKCRNTIGLTAGRGSHSNNESEAGPHYHHRPPHTRYLPLKDQNRSLTFISAALWSSDPQLRALLSL
jgi:hypothetical protein